jgi:hypothetical protein
MQAQAPPFQARANGASNGEEATSNRFGRRRETIPKGGNTPCKRFLNAFPTPS